MSESTSVPERQPLVKRSEPFRVGTGTILALFLRRFPWFVAAYFAIQTGRRLIEPHDLGLDEAEQMLLTQIFDWGYGTQPPLYTWLQIGVFDVFGRSILSLALLKNAVLLLTFLLFFRAAEHVFRDRLKAVAVTLSLFFIPQIAWESQRALVHTVIVVCAAAGTLVAFLDIVAKRRLVDYALFGLAVGVGVLSKYNYPIFAAGLLTAALSTPAGRSAIFDRRMFVVSLPLSVAVVLPTILWSLGNLDLLLARTRKFGIDPERHLVAAWWEGTSSLVIAALAFSAVCLVLFTLVAFLPLRWGKGRAASGEEAGREDMRRIVLLTPVACLLILLVFVMATGTTEIKDRWLQPYLFILPLSCFVALERRLDRPRQLALAGMGGVLAVAVVPLLLAYNRLPDLWSEPSRAAAPFDRVAEGIRAVGFSEGTIVGAGYVVGNLMFHFPRAQGISPGYPRISIARRFPILLAWEGDLREAVRVVLNDALSTICGTPLPSDIEAKPIRAPYWNSRNYVLTLNVAVFRSCPNEPVNGPG